MVFVEVPPELGDASAFVRQMREVGVRVNAPNRRRVRFVTHFGIDAAAITEALNRLARITKPETVAKRRAS